MDQLSKINRIVWHGARHTNSVMKIKNNGSFRVKDRSSYTKMPGYFYSSYETWERNFHALKANVLCWLQAE